MSRGRAAERFHPGDRAVPLTTEQMQDFGIRDYTEPKEFGDIDGIHLVRQRFYMADGWNYDTTSTVLSDDQKVTTVSGTMTGGWFTQGEHGFNARRLATMGKHGSEWTFVSVPMNTDRLWGNMENNAYNQVRIGLATAAIFGRHPSVFFEDGLSRGAMHGESVLGVAPELGARVIAGYNTVPCRINGVEEVNQLDELIRYFEPDNVMHMIKERSLPPNLTAAHIARTGVRAVRALGEALGNEVEPVRKLITTPLAMFADGATPREVADTMMAKIDPKSIAIPYKIMSRYPRSLDVRPVRFARQLLEAYTLMNGTYGTLAQKVSPNQLQVISGFTLDGLSHYEEIVAAHAPESHPNTFINMVEGGNHMMCVIEEQNRKWSEDWGDIIESTAEMDSEILRLDEMSPKMSWDELHKRLAGKNAFFANQLHAVDAQGIELVAA